MSYSLVSLDLDGTLVDTAAEIAEAAGRALEEHGLKRPPVPEIVSFIGMGTRELIRQLVFGIVGDELPWAATVSLPAVQASMDRHYAITTGTSAVPYPRAREALERFRAAGVALACVTNKESRHAHRVLEVTGLSEYFALVIGGDTLPIKKPDPGVLGYVIETLGGTAARTAHVGDSRIDIEAARNAGVAAWAVPYGYNGGRPIAEANPDRIFENLGAVADHVLGAPVAATG
ncbi:MAG: HAD-IA family hydrolase [Gemmatimonadales bacterium]